MLDEKIRQEFITKTISAAIIENHKESRSTSSAAANGVYEILNDIEAHEKLRDAKAVDAYLTSVMKTLSWMPVGNALREFLDAVTIQLSTAKFLQFKSLATLADHLRFILYSDNGSRIDPARIHNWLEKARETVRAGKSDEPITYA